MAKLPKRRKNVAQSIGPDAAASERGSKAGTGSVSAKAVISAAEFAAAQEHFETFEKALLREPLPGETTYFIGFSLRQEEPVLLSADVEDGWEEICAAADEAYGALWDRIPTEFIVNRKVVATIRTGFWDCSGNEVDELTFPNLWTVSLLQKWIDDHGSGICLRMAGEATARRKVEADGREWRRLLLEPPKSAADLELAVRTRVPPIGQVTTMLLTRWAQCDESFAGGDFHYNSTNSFRCSGDQAFLSVVVGHGDRREAALRHILEHAEPEAARLFAIKVHALGVREAARDVNRMAAPAIGKQMMLARQRFSIALEQDVRAIFGVRE